MTLGALGDHSENSHWNSFHMSYSFKIYSNEVFDLIGQKLGASQPKQSIFDDCFYRIFICNFCTSRDSTDVTDLKHILCREKKIT